MDGLAMTRARGLALALGLTATLPLPSEAIVIDAARPYEHAISSNLLSGRHGGIGYVSTGCSGVAISHTAVLSAAHCFSGSRARFTVPIKGSADFSTRATVEIHPYFGGGIGSPADLAVMRLHEALPASTMVYGLADFDTAPIGAVVELVGYGKTGTGLTGEQAFTAGRRGTLKHFGFNELDNTVNGGATLITDFDGNGHNRLGSAGLGAMEAFAAFGDSGGPMLLGGRPDDGLEIGSQAWIDAIYEAPPLVLGLASYYRRYNRNSEFATYGATGGHTSVANYIDWIVEKVPEAHLVSGSEWNAGGPAPMPTPLPPALGMILGALALLAPLMRQRRRIPAA